MTRREPPSSSAAPSSESADARFADAHFGDGDLVDGDLVDALRRAHADEEPPSFVATVAAARSHGARRWAPAFALAGAAVAAVAFSFAQPSIEPAVVDAGDARDDGDERRVEAASAWETSTSLSLPTDFLLEIPGRELLATQPEF